VTLHSLPAIPSAESLSYSSDVSCPLEIHLLTMKCFVSFPKNYSMNYCIDVCDIPQYRALTMSLYSYNNGIVWSSIHFLSLLLHYCCCYHLIFLLFESRSKSLSLNCFRLRIVSLISPFAPLKAVSGGIGFLARKFS